MFPGNRTSPVWIDSSRNSIKSSAASRPNSTASDVRVYTRSPVSTPSCRSNDLQSLYSLLPHQLLSPRSCCCRKPEALVAHGEFNGDGGAQSLLADASTCRSPSIVTGLPSKWRVIEHRLLTHFFPLIYFVTVIMRQSFSSTCLISSPDSDFNDG